MSLLPSHSPYMHRLELSSRCTGESHASQSVMDLTNLLSDKTGLQQVLGDLYRPFEAQHVDQIVALHVEGEPITPDANGEVAANETGAYRFTTAIAGAIAGAKQLAYGELSVIKKKNELKSPSKTTIRASKCKRVVNVDCGDGKFTVELKRKAIKETARANDPSEDRSLNIVKAADEGVQINAVFDGHGGSRAVEHLRTSLCQHILAAVSSRNSSDEVSAIVKSAFARSDEELKQSLLALPENTRMSKGYCNAGACAVIALFINSVLYIANVGDCAAVLGKVSKETQGLQAIAVSVDHSCNNPQETKLVVERSHDRNAIRMSKDDQATGAGVIGVKRVAGSLAMTRAFGDFYLKCPELSSAPFKSKVPYITSEPSITTVYMDGSEKYVILASDGLWDVMTPQEAVHIVDKFGPEQSLFFSTASAALIHAALEKIAHRDGLMMHELMSMPQGSVRRRFHDDITCTVVYIEHQNGSQQTLVGPSTKESTPKA
ncbi:hypothetical protein JG688_00009812 [Phytophthora aleatoria]|uniref:PPM-type phosphatase domain-containing protein n=1 Tax=Phytophthora aleatoria TaxID=2496075 RepID=A0A8J5INJ3_9STRA|nr:hypothetical protein JG688_00009812 [Phytophthora aleatoria]